MHYKSLLAVEMSAVEEDKEWEAEITHTIEKLTECDSNELFGNIFLRIYIEALVNKKTAFSRELNEKIRENMERFHAGTQDKRYLEFEDRTEEYESTFNEKVDCIKTADGTIHEADFCRIGKKYYCIRDGLVYQTYAGPLQHPKRTKSAKRMKVLQNYSRDQIYKSFEQYVNEACYGVRNQENGRYGVWFNPNGLYDWYQIGGRWPAVFLVKKTCGEYSLGERCYLADEKYPAPEGYRWVCAARKKDIQWDVMRKWENQCAIEQFQKLEAMFLSGIIDDAVHGIVNDKGIICQGELVYRKGETLEEYLKEYGIPETWKYPLQITDVFINGTWMDESCTTNNPKSAGNDDWQSIVAELIDEANDNTVFVGIDYHI